MSDATQSIPVRRISPPVRVSASPWAFVPAVILAAVLFAAMVAVIGFEAYHAGRIDPACKCGDWT